MVEPLECERLPRLRSIVEGLAEVGFTVAVFDTAGADSAAARLITDAADICLLPARPARLDVEATAATFRAAFLAKRKAAFVLNQCPSTYRSSRTGKSARSLTRLGVLAEPMLSARMDFQDAIAAGLGVTEYAPQGRAAQEIEELWSWVRGQFKGIKNETSVYTRPVARPRPKTSAKSVAVFRPSGARGRTWSVTRQTTNGNSRSILRVIGATTSLAIH